MAADEARLLYRDLAIGGEFLEPLAASLMRNWYEGAPEDPFIIPPGHIKGAMLYDKPKGKSPRDQLYAALCDFISDKRLQPAGRLSGKEINLRATEGVYYHAFGGFKITFMGSYSCNRKGKCSFEGLWEFYDKYDWHQGLDANVLGTTIPDSWALLVEQYHGAKRFTESGTFDGKVKVQCECRDFSEPGGR